MALLPDQKFSTFQDGGDLIVGDIVVGLRGGINTRFDYTGELPAGVVVPISQGGTGATTAGGARTNLGLGTIATQDANAVAITGGTIDGVAITTSTAQLTSGSVAATPTADIDLANKKYVDDNVSKFTYLNPVKVASTANFASTYDNGTAGVGATLTDSSNGAASIDGVSLALNDRVLFKDQTNTFENGIYVVSQVGDGSNPAIYTRADDFNEPDEIVPGDLAIVLEGTVNEKTAWLQTADVTTIGTDPILWVQFTADFSNVVTIDGTQTITGAKTFNDLTLGGDMDADSNKIINLADPTDPQDAVTKSFLESEIGNTFSQVTVQTFSSNGTYTPTPGMKYCIVEAVAAGGGGGGADANPGSTASAGNGGGSGSYAEGIFSAADIGASQVVTIGTGGAGGSGGSGGNGGVTSFGALKTLNGGIGGGQGPARSAVGATPGVGSGGAPGTGGHNNFRGAAGGIGLAGSAGNMAVSGFGASSHFGGGGSPVVNSTANGSSTGANGSGGSGGASIAGGGATSGGAGTGGYMEIIEFIGA